VDCRYRRRQYGLYTGGYSERIPTREAKILFVKKNLIWKSKAVGYSLEFKSKERKEGRIMDQNLVKIRFPLGNPRFELIRREFYYGKRRISVPCLFLRKCADRFCFLTPPESFCPVTWRVSNRFWRTDKYLRLRQAPNLRYGVFYVCQDITKQPLILKAPLISLWKKRVGYHLILSEKNIILTNLICSARPKNR
jgi:hypothetical protein